jgi:hypothetical protein
LTLTGSCDIIRDTKLKIGEGRGRKQKDVRKQKKGENRIKEAMMKRMIETRMTTISLTVVALVAFMALTLSAHSATLEVFHFNLSNTLVDLDPAGGEYYGEVVLEITAPNTIEIVVNPFDSTETVDALGVAISSPLVAGPNFGVQTFALNVALTDNESEITDRYDIELPTGWDYSTDANISEFGSFEFRTDGTGNTRQDPLEITIKPKAGADLTGYEFSDVNEFIGANPERYLFAAHIAGFTVAPEYLEEGIDFAQESAWFGVTEAPEPSMAIVMLIGLLTRRYRRK